MAKLGAPDPGFCMTYLSGGTSIRYCARHTAFTVAAGAHTITFQGVDTAGGDNTAFVDDVSVHFA